MTIWAAEPAGGMPVCLGEQLDKLPQTCQQELTGLVQQNQAIKLERDAARAEVQRLEQRLEQGRLGALGPVEPLAEGKLSEEGWGKTRWGMRRAEIKQLYPDAESGAKGAMTLDLVVADLPAMVKLQFQKGRLADADVVFLRKSFDRIEDLVAEYGGLKDLLTDKYGSPKLDEADLIARGQVGAEQASSQAESQGEVGLTTTWQTAKSDIVLSCSGKLSDVDLQIHYSSRELEVGQKKKLLENL